MRQNKQIKVDTKTSKIYQIIKKNILSNRIAPGEKLVAAQMAEDYGVSVIPIREAFNQLKAEGFIEVIPHTGAFVKDMDIDYLLNIYPIRGLLEGYAAKLACAHLTENDYIKLEKVYDKINRIIEKKMFSNFSKLNYEFHMFIYRASGNQPLVKMIDDLMDTTYRVRYTYDLMPDRALSSNIEHRGILEALKKRLADQVEMEVRRHIEITLEKLIKAVANNNQN